MAIAYVYYTNNSESIGVHIWEPQTPTERYQLTPYKGSSDMFACSTVMINFPQNTITVRKNNNVYTSTLREPTRDIQNLKHQAHFDFAPVDWDDWAEAY